MFNRTRQSQPRRPAWGGSGGGSRRFGGNMRGGGRGGFKRSSFDPSLLVRKAVQIVKEVYVSTNSFADFALCEPLQQNILDRGYITPTPIQDETIPLLLQGRDLIGLANTGTGKTAAFLLPLINKVYLNEADESVLIVAPTRELATQIDQEFRLFARGMKLYSTLCIGGVNIRPQIADLRRKPHFVIGTPGRLRDLEGQGALHFESFQSIVLDEVDQMFDMGFIRDVKYIAAKLPPVRQSLFFSATLNEALQSVMQSFLTNPVKVSVKSHDAASNVDQDVIRVTGQSKMDVLHELLIKEEFNKVIVFLRTKRETEQVARALDDRGFKVGSIHGNKNQGQRQRAIDEFKRSRTQILVATDVASRGLDIDDVSHVINFDLPETYDDYIHRIGRTGRASKKGIALTFVG